MRYNTQRKKLKFMDYGRAVEGLIQQAKTIEDRQQRNLAAQTIVEVMARVVPHSRENTGWKQRMWDHMMVLADWELDVDWPVWAGLKPDTNHEKDIATTPRRLEYKTKKVKYRHYGRIIEGMVEKAQTLPDGKEKDELVRQIIASMKRNYSAWNNSVATDDVIYKHLFEMSGGTLDYQSTMRGDKVAQSSDSTDTNATTDSPADENNEKNQVDE